MTDDLTFYWATTAGPVRRSRLKTGGGTYLPSHDPREILGIGQASKVEWVEIRWPAPSGCVERFINLPIDRYVELIEGQGKPVPEPERL